METNILTFLWYEITDSEVSWNVFDGYRMTADDYIQLNIFFNLSICRKFPKYV